MTHAMIFMRELNEKNDKHFHKRYDKNGREHLYCLPFSICVTYITNIQFLYTFYLLIS